MHRIALIIGCAAPLAGAGCTVGRAAHLAAADAIDALTLEIERAVVEYRDDTVRCEDRREHEVIEAFLARTRSTNREDANRRDDAAAFQAALERIRSDRDVETQRFRAVQDNLSLLREIAGRLRDRASAAMALSDPWTSPTRSSAAPNAGRLD